LDPEILWDHEHQVVLVDLQVLVFRDDHADQDALVFPYGQEPPLNQEDHLDQEDLEVQEVLLSLVAQQVPENKR
jgi:hypothetical protein